MPDTEPTLQITYNDLREECGYRFGYGRDTTLWSTEDVDNVARMLKDGLLLAYGFHDWAFLKPRLTITTVASTSSYDLPANYGGPEGDLTYAAGTDRARSVRITSDVQLRNMQQGASITGFPCFAAIIHLASEGVHSQRKQMVFYPTPDAAYALTGQFAAMQNELTAERPVPLGGQNFGHVLKAACLAAGERLLEKSGDQGPLYQAFVREATKYRLDEAGRVAPNTLGFNGAGDASFAGDTPESRSALAVTYEGDYYD